MTEMAQEVSGQVSSPAPISSVAPAETSAPQPTERVFKQSEVNELVGREKHEAVERYKRQQQSQQQLGQQNTQQQASPNPPQPQASQFSEDDIKRMTASEIQRLRDQWIEEQQRIATEQEAKRIATEFYGKFNRGKDEYQDWDSVVSGVDLGKFPDIVQYATSVDNTHDVMYDLIKNKHKASQLRQIAHDWGQEEALRYVQELSTSIKANKDAANARTPNAPLSQLKPSHTGTDSGQKSVRDYRRNPLFRV